ncbi:MAG: ABC transporter permease [Chloroflexota bacterium]
MRKIATLVWKDTILRFSSASEILFFLILPIVFTFLLGGGFVSTFATEENTDSRIPLLVVNEDDSDLAQALLDVLSTSETVRVDTMNRDDAEAAFADETAPALLLIPAGFADALLTGETAVLDLRQLPDDNNATIARRAVNTAVSYISRPLNAARASVTIAAERQPFADNAARHAYFTQSLALAQDLAAETPQRVTLTQPETATTPNGDYNPATQSSVGQLITWVFIPLLGTSGFLALERRRGTLRRLLTTPTQKATYLLGTITSQFLVGLVQMILLIGFGILVMHVNWGNSLGGLTILLVAFALTSVAFGTMLGTFVKTESQASNLSIMLGMSMALLGGCWWPMELFPPAVQNVVKVLPTTWAMQGLTDMVMRGQGVSAVLLEI